MDVTKKSADVHTLSTRLPESLFQAMRSASAITGQSINQLIIQGCEHVVDSLSSQASTLVSNTSNASIASSGTTASFVVEAPQLGMVRQAYASSPRWSQEPRRPGAALTKWTSTPEEEKTDEQ